MTYNKILVIEDEPSLSDLLRMNLEAVGYEVETVFDGVKAKRIIAQESRDIDMLLLFFRNRNMAFTRDQLLNKVWGSSYAGETRTVDVHIAQLRKKLKVAGRIQKIPKLGYRLEV